ncbi:MAG TPA: DUF4238 domain-containing protein [Gemmataceae bacterium]
MSDRKSQHFVPQFYLSNFSVKETDRKVALYHIPSSRFVAGAPIKSQACEDNFYKEIGIESALGDIEGAAARIIREAIEDGTLPKRFTEDHHVLLLFVLLQAARTPAAADKMTDALNRLWRKVASEIPGMEEHAEGIKVKIQNTPGFLLHIATANYPMALDLRWKLLQNKTSLPFITCDHPTVSYNQFLEPCTQVASNTGLVCRGLQKFLPLSPKHVLVLFDSATYKVGGMKLRVMSVDVAHEDDVDGLNLLQAINADDTLYFSDETKERYIKDLVRRAEKYRRVEASMATKHKGIAPDGTVGELYAISKADIRTNMKLRCIKVLPSADAKPLDQRAVQARDIQLLHLFDAFQREVRSGCYKPTHFGKWLRDKFGDAEPSH